MSEIRNAIVKNVKLDNADRGFLNAWLDLDYGGAVQGFGGYALYLPKSFGNHKLNSVAGHFIWRCMEIAGVTEWSKIEGKAVRAKIENGLVVAIGHITNDDWFEPRQDFTDET